LLLSFSYHTIAYLHLLYIGNSNQEKEERGKVKKKEEKRVLQKHPRSNAKRAEQPKERGKKDSLSFPSGL